MEAHVIPMNAAVEALVAAGFKSAVNCTVEQVQEQLNKLDTVITPEYVDGLEGKPKKLLKRVMSVLENNQFTVTPSPSTSQGTPEVTATTPAKKRVKPSKPAAEPEAQEAPPAKKRVKPSKPAAETESQEAQEAPPAKKRVKPSKAQEPAEAEVGASKKHAKSVKSEDDSDNESPTTPRTRARREGSQAQRIDDAIKQSFRRRAFRPQELFEQLPDIRLGRIRDHLTHLISKNVLERQTDGEYRVVAKKTKA